MTEASLIGVDCAVDPAKTGFCRGRYEDGLLRVTEATSGKGASPARLLAGWMTEEPLLIGLDAPLGWPAALGDSLARHRAGDALEPAAHALFRRRTDDFTASEIGKRPMDVGADRIARTARAALGLLQELRETSGRPCALGWRPGEPPTGTVVLETYPAAWLKVNGLRHSAYKKPDQRARREGILTALPDFVELECGRAPFLDDADILDALLCLLVCVDYLDGNVAAPPSDLADAARREGWIWFPTRRRSQTGSAPDITSR